MKTTYTVTAKSLDFKNLAISYSDLSCLSAKTVVEMLAYAFRQIDVLNEQTGEVEYTVYKSPDFFCRYDKEVEAMQKVALFLAEK